MKLRLSHGRGGGTPKTNQTKPNQLPLITLQYYVIYANDFANAKKPNDETDTQRGQQQSTYTILNPPIALHASKGGRSSSASSGLDGMCTAV